MPISKNVTKFDTSQVNSVLRAIVAETPAGHRYVAPNGRANYGEESCYYVDAQGKGSCLVGRVAERLGLPLPTWGTYNNGVLVRESIFAQHFTGEALTRLQTVQTRQDSGETWRRAIR